MWETLANIIALIESITCSGVFTNTHTCTHTVDIKLEINLW